MNTIKEMKLRIQEQKGEELKKKEKIEKRERHGADGLFRKVKQELLAKKERELIEETGFTNNKFLNKIVNDEYRCNSSCSCYTGRQCKAGVGTSTLDGTGFVSECAARKEAFMKDLMYYKEKGIITELEAMQVFDREFLLRYKLAKENFASKYKAWMVITPSEYSYVRNKVKELKK